MTHTKDPRIEDLKESPLSIVKTEKITASFILKSLRDLDPNTELSRNALYDEGLNSISPHMAALLNSMHEGSETFSKILNDSVNLCFANDGVFTAREAISIMTAIGDFRKNTPKENAAAFMNNGIARGVADENTDALARQVVEKFDLDPASQDGLKYLAMRAARLNNSFHELFNPPAVAVDEATAPLTPPPGKSLIPGK